MKEPVIKSRDKKSWCSNQDSKSKKGKRDITALRVYAKAGHLNASGKFEVEREVT